MIQLLYFYVNSLNTFLLIFKYLLLYYSLIEINKKINEKNISYYSDI